MPLQPVQRSSADRSKPCKSPSSEQWLALKPRINYLYCEMDMNLKDVMQLMGLEYGFYATYEVPNLVPCYLPNLPQDEDVQIPYHSLGHQEE